MKKILLFCCGFLILGCSFNVNKLVETKKDLVQADFYPSKEEISPSQATAIVVFSDTLLNAESLFLMKFQEILLEETGVIITSIDKKLSYNQAIDLAFTQKADYTIFVEQTYENNLPYYFIAIYYNPYNKQVLNSNWIPNSEKQTKAIRQDLQTYLPHKGFILETKNERKYAKINLGKNINLKKGDIFFVFSRKIVKSTTIGIYKQTNIQYSEKPLGQIEVIHIEKDHSWSIISTTDRDTIQAGMPVFLSRKK